MARELPPILRSAERLLVDVESAVTRFPRKHKYQLGADLRQVAMQIARTAHRAWQRPQERRHLIDLLDEHIETMKLYLQVGKQVQAFGSFGEFEAVSRLVNDLGRQCGGWRKQQGQMGQNVAPDARETQRAPILSSRTALAGVNP